MAQPKLLPDQRCPACGVLIAAVITTFTPTSNVALTSPCHHEVTLSVSTTGILVRPWGFGTT